MGDIVTLIERAEASFEEEEARRVEEKLRTATFDLEDFQKQLQQVKRMGPLSQLIEMIPGFASLSRSLPQGVTDQQMKKIEAIINSMTPEERRNPRIIGGGRKRRIARGSGTTVQEVNQLLGQFRQMQKVMKQLKFGRVDITSIFGT
jgi:signal recognition particle subunit SRP54